jgi:hypothetical protein
MSFDDLDDDTPDAADQGSGYRYYERDGQLFRGELEQGFSRCHVTEWLVGGEWQRSLSDFGPKAQAYGDRLTEAEARKWAGADWPKEPATSRSNVVAIGSGTSQVSSELISELELLLERARAGTVTGAALVVLRSDDGYELRLCGCAAETGSQMSVVGMLARLQKMVLESAD